MSEQYQLLRDRRFAPFFLTQFSGALNDNVFKVALTGLITYQAQFFPGLAAGSASFMISALFILPFVLFSATSGQIADAYDKARVMQGVKWFELIIMLIATAGFWQHSFTLLALTTFLLGVHSTIFGPVKFAYLPQILTNEQLTGGNGLVEMGTFIAILAGTLLGGLLSQSSSSPQWGHANLGLICMVIAIAGILSAYKVPTALSQPSAFKINWNPYTETRNNLRLARESRPVFLSLLGISWLWFLGVTFLTSFFNFSKQIIGGNQDVVSLMLALFSIGIALGSLLCERLSSGKIEIGLVPFGSIGISVFAIDLYFASHHMNAADLVTLSTYFHDLQRIRIAADLFLLAMFAGFYSVPLYALIQSRSAPSHRARIIGANNILNAVFMIVASVVGMLVLGPLNGTIPQLFLLVGILNIAVAIYIYSLVPEFLLRFLAWLMIHTIYRVRVQGLNHLPQEGAALLTCNHVSFADAVILMACSPRPIRFIMDEQIFKTPILGFIFRQSRAIPIGSRHANPAAVDQALATASQAIRDGELVGIFPEGKITQDGTLNTFKRGYLQILQNAPAPLIPIALQGLWGSFFSRKHGPAMTRLRGIHSKITIIIAPPHPQTEPPSPPDLQRQTENLLLEQPNHS